MPMKVGSRIWETDAANGLNNFTLDGAVGGYRAFSAVAGNNDTIRYYAVLRDDPTQWERGVGTWTTGNNLARTKIEESSSGAKVNFGAGTLDIFSDEGPMDEDCLFSIAISDEATALSAGATKVTLHAPFDFRLTDVFAGVSTVSSSGNPAFDVNKNGASIFGTTITIDSGEDTSLTATTAYAFTGAASSIAFAKGDKITIDIDTAGTGTKGAKLYFLGRRGQ